MTKKGVDDMTKIPERNNGAALIAKVALEEALMLYGRPDISNIDQGKTGPPLIHLPRHSYQ